MKHLSRRSFMGALGAAAGAAYGTEAWAKRLPSEGEGNAGNYEIAAYYFGNYHLDHRNEIQHGPGWTEWRLVEAARPRFEGHIQPKVPLWGYENEAEPAVFERKIKAASDSGLSAFIFDWYWYNDGPFLEAALEKGYLGASNREQLKFAIMWANHDWYDIHPAKLSSPPTLQFPGKVTPETFRTMTDHIVNNYFRSSSYWMLDQCPYFSIYELFNFVASMGGVRPAAKAIEDFRVKTRAAGFRDLHLNAVTWGVKLLPGQTDVVDLKSLLEQLQIDSTTSYVWLHHAEMSSFPVAQYDGMAKKYEEYRATASEKLGKPYYPNVSMGWDSSPRACQTDVYIKKGYPFLPVIQGNTPENFGNALRSAKSFLDNSPHLKNKVLTINSWNEWTEGSYLEPDTENGYGYLDQIGNVFPKPRRS